MLEPMVLIETSWNVKMVSISTFFTFTRINRNIVECKGKRKYVQLRFPDVLIETSWNVKTGIYPLSLAVWWVLIETSWNVKWRTLHFRTSPNPRINRNIVECKDKKSHINYAGFICINRNIVECKDPEQLTILSSFPY